MLHKTSFTTSWSPQLMEERLISRLLKLNKWEEDLVGSAQVDLLGWVALVSKSQDILRKFSYIVYLFLEGQLLFHLMEQVAVEAKTIPQHHPRGIMREVEMTVTEDKVIIKATVAEAIIIMAVQVAEVVEDTTDTAVILIETTAEVEVATSW